MDELTREFLIESQEGLDRMERCLTELETHPGDTAILAEIFRSVHTIKGTTGFLGFKRLERLAHAGENLLGLLRDGAVPADPPVITGLLQLLDGLRLILKIVEAEDGEGTGSDDELIERLRQLQQPVAATSPVPGRGAPSVPESHATSHAGALDPAPPADPSRNSSDDRKPALRSAAAPTPQSGLPASPSLELQDAASPGTGAPPIDRSAKPGSSAAESTLRVDVALLNRMMNLVGELVLTRNQVLQATAADPGMTLLSRRLDMVTADLREAVMKARLQPISNIFSKMPRIVRDLCNVLGRQVRLEMDGQETELDKSLLEAIKDPLTHAVRNALDHGIEPPQVRVAASKSAEGLLRLRAAQEGSHVLIEVIDDGAGIAVDRVRQKAIDRGLVSPERAGQMADRELLQFLFVPGFSTAAAVTSVSGRGVGMDVVRTNVERIGGKVELDSRPGKGTTLRLRIPLTLAIIPALIVRSLGQSFAVPQGALSELVHLTSEQAASAIEWIEDAALYRLRGRLLPLVFLERLLRPNKTQARSQERDAFIAVLDADGRRFGLVVDGLADPEEIVVKPLSAVLKSIGLYSGATVLGNGDLALILDPGAIAVRSRVALAEEDLLGMQESAVEANARLQYLLVELAGGNAAIPLGDVLRIEQVPATQVEYIGPHPVLQFDGQVLPVEDRGDLLPAARTTGAPVIIVVCRDGARHLGIAVSHVLDVAAGSDLVEAGTSQRTPDAKLLNNRVTGVVNLGGMAPFTASLETSNQWAQQAG